MVQSNAPRNQEERNNSNSVAQIDTHSATRNEPPQTKDYDQPSLDPTSSPRWYGKLLSGIGIGGTEGRFGGDTQLINSETMSLNPRHRYYSYGAAESGLVSGRAISGNQSGTAIFSTPTITLNRRLSLQSLSSVVSLNSTTVPTIIRVFNRRSSTYDDLSGAPQDNDDIMAAEINGIRVWYSSFQSVDWLHDAIKEVTRLRHLQKRRCLNLSSYITHIMDRFSGWLVVSFTGAATAIVAFIIIRSEQWLFDLKEGHCKTGFFKTFERCCQASHDTKLEELHCGNWQAWHDLIISQINDPERWVQPWFIQRMTYLACALLLAFTSSVFTVTLTASSNFITHKDFPSLQVNDANGRHYSHLADRGVMYYAAGSGIPEVKTILSGFVIHGYLGARILIAKSIALTCSVASGLSIGREGPMVHIASCIGNIISRSFMKYENNEGKRREILSAASAAGIAVAFGAPIGGVLFSLEEVSYFFPPKVLWKSFFCAMIAAITLKLLDPFGTGKLVLFQVTYNQDWHAFELFFFVMIGVFGGVYGAIFSGLYYKWNRCMRNGTWLKTHPISEVLLVTLVTAISSPFNRYTRMDGTKLVYNLFAECKPNDLPNSLCEGPGTITAAVKDLGVTLLVKGTLTLVTFGVKLPGGILIPTLGIGACFGRITGLIVTHLQWRYPNALGMSVRGEEVIFVNPAVYAMVGAAAALSGVTRMTVALAVIMFELTHTLTYTMPVMLAILLAKSIADTLGPKGIYDQIIDLFRLPYLDPKHQSIWAGFNLDDVVHVLSLICTGGSSNSQQVDRKVDIIRADHTNSVETLKDKLRSSLSAGTNDDGFPVLRRNDGRLLLVGYIGLNELDHALNLISSNSTQAIRFQSAEETQQLHRRGSISSSTFAENLSGTDLFDFTAFMDRAPLTVQIHSPLELLQQMFVKLGVRYIVVTEANGAYVGVVSKKAWLEFIGDVDI